MTSRIDFQFSIFNFQFSIIVHILVVWIPAIHAGMTNQTYAPIHRSTFQVESSTSQIRLNLEP